MSLENSTEKCVSVGQEGGLDVYVLEHNCRKDGAQKVDYCPCLRALNMTIPDIQQRPPDLSRDQDILCIVAHELKFPAHGVAKDRCALIEGKFWEEYVQECFSNLVGSPDDEKSTAEMLVRDRLRVGELANLIVNNKEVSIQYAHEYAHEIIGRGLGATQWQADSAHAYAKTRSYAVTSDFAKQIQSCLIVHRIGTENACSTALRLKPHGEVNGSSRQMVSNILATITSWTRVGCPTHTG